MGTYITVIPGLLKLRHTRAGWRVSVGPRILREHFGAGGRGVSTGAGPFSYYAPVRVRKAGRTARRR